MDCTVLKLVMGVPGDRLNPFPLTQPAGPVEEGGHAAKVGVARQADHVGPVRAVRCLVRPAAVVARGSVEDVQLGELIRLQAQFLG